MKSEQMLTLMLMLMIFCITVLALSAASGDPETIRQAIRALADLVR